MNMSKPSVWNGRNEKILGTSGTVVTNDAQPTSSVEDPKPSAPSSEKKSKKAIGPVAPAPSKNVWNGRHDKIKEIRDPEAKAESEDATPKEESNNNSSNIRLSITSKHEIKEGHQGKEDESTNSTAGSSTTNIGEDPAEYDSKIDQSSGTKVATSVAGVANEAGQSSRRNRASSDLNGSTRRSHSGGHKNGKGNRLENGIGHNKYNRSGNGASNGRRRGHNGEKPKLSYFMKGIGNSGPNHSFTQSPPPVYSNNPYTTKGKPSPSGPNRFRPARVFDPLKARAIALSKEAQDREDRSKFVSPVDGSEERTFFSIDVECIATGYGSCARGINDGCGNEGRNGADVPPTQFNDRSQRYPGRVAMVDSDGNLVTDIIIRPPHDGKGVVSYLTALTGLNEEICLGPDAKPLSEALKIIREALPNDAVLVGQSIDHDIAWLGLTAGKDFAYSVDIAEIFRQRTPKVLHEASAALKKMEESGDTRHVPMGEAGGVPGGEKAVAASSMDMSSDEYLGFATKYRSFSLRHVCVNLLGEDIQSGVHNPITDAKYSLILFHKYRNSSVTQLRIVRDALHRAPITPGFVAENSPVIDGVCVSSAAYRYKRAARTIWRWYSGKKSACC
mmetsp:Transcript_28975/g.61017  ORF Transcript_28975/g.61017 Transcript_28975/m.61017 type:complete len:616 (+) Transcript_28975:468-2315(+)